MAQEIDLDLIGLSVPAVEAWHAMAERVAVALAQMRRVGDSSIPDERARVNDDGTLTIFVSIPGVMDISMDVPADQWQYLH